MENKEQLLKLQQIEYSILETFAKICDQHQLKYFLVGGSCLGMIRHQGFIPWDDDIDVGMPRKDYEKFCQVAKTELPPDLVLQNIDTEKKCGLVFGKIRKKGTVLSENYSYHIDMNQGVWIDIFPYDYVSDDEKIRQKEYRRVLLYKNLYIIKCGYKNPKPESIVYNIAYALAKIIVFFIPLDFFVKKVKSGMTKYSKTNHVFPFGGAYPKKDLFTSDLIEEVIQLPFEKGIFSTFKQYDRYLKSLYGDYMKLPPEDKRKSGMHNIHEIRL